MSVFVIETIYEQELRLNNSFPYIKINDMTIVSHKLNQLRDAHLAGSKTGASRVRCHILYPGRGDLLIWNTSEKRS